MYLNGLRKLSAQISYWVNSFFRGGTILQLVELSGFEKILKKHLLASQSIIIVLIFLKFIFFP